jgi:hypothetical protein
MIFSGALQLGQLEFVKTKPLQKHGWMAREANDQKRKRFSKIQIQKIR